MRCHAPEESTYVKLRDAKDGFQLRTLTDYKTICRRMLENERENMPKDLLRINGLFENSTIKISQKHYALKTTLRCSCLRY